MFICVYLSVIIHLRYLPDNCSAEGTHTFMCNSLFSQLYLHFAIHTLFAVGSTGFSKKDKHFLHLKKTKNKTQHHNYIHIISLNQNKVQTQCTSIPLNYFTNKYKYNNLFCLEKHSSGIFFMTAAEMAHKSIHSCLMSFMIHVPCVEQLHGNAGRHGQPKLKLPPTS